MKVSDYELFQMLLEVDEEAYSEGEDVKQRAWSNPQRVMSKLGYINYVMAGVGTPAEFERLRNMQKQLYRPQDTGVGGVHLGVFLFRDVFAKISIPLGYGKFGFDPLSLTDLNELQCGWLSSRPLDFQIFMDQVIDLFDFGYGLIEIGSVESMCEECRTLLHLSHFQQQAAAAIVTGAYDFRGAVQSAILSMELSLKAGLAARGMAEADRRQLGHDLPKLARSLAERERNLDASRVIAAVERLPSYVANRYAPAQPDRRETGRIVMSGQYVGAEVMRQLTDRNLRENLAPCPARSFPPVG